MPMPTEQQAAASRRLWSNAFGKLRRRNFGIACSRAWQALIHSSWEFVPFFIRYLWVFILVLLIFVICCLLAFHKLAGLNPEPIARVEIHHDQPSTDSHLKVTLIPPLSSWETPSSPAQELDFDLENDGDQPGTLTGSLLGSPSTCFTPVPFLVRPLPAHTVQPLVLRLDLDTHKCSLPLQVAFTFHYFWALDKQDGKKGHRLSSNSRTEAVQVPAGTSAPVNLNLSIQLPPNARYTRVIPGQPERHFSGSITTGPILVTSGFAASVHRLLALGASLASKFTWPILIAFLTIAGQNALARRGERQQIRTSRLDALTTLMQDHYLPITRRIATVTIEANDFFEARKHFASLPASSDAAVFHHQRLFTAVLLMRRRILSLVESKGGVFFPRPLAEEIFTASYGYFYGQFKSSTGDADHCESLAMRLDLNFQLHEAHALIFPPRRPIPEQTKQALAGFSAWIETSITPYEFERYLVFLSLAKAVMLFEFDRVQYETHAPVFEQRFLDPPQFAFTGNLERLPAFDGPPAPDLDVERLDFLAKCANYFEGIPEECRPRLLYPKP